MRCACIINNSLLLEVITHIIFSFIILLLVDKKEKENEEVRERRKERRERGKKWGVSWDITSQNIKCIMFSNLNINNNYIKSV